MSDHGPLSDFWREKLNVTIWIAKVAKVVGMVRVKLGGELEGSF